MSTPPNKAPAAKTQVVVVGGGISGLVAALRLQQAGFDYVLLEKSERLGGKLYSLRQDDGYLLEIGADAILTRKPWAWELAQEIGLGDRIMGVNKVKTGTYVLHGGKPVPLPDGLQLLVPTKWGPFWQSSLFSTAGKLRAMMDLVIPRRKSTEDESLASFIRRRLGDEMLVKVADPMLAGVFNGESERQSILATFPQFPAIEKEHGSLIRGLRGKKPEATGKPAFFSFVGGTQELAAGVAAKLTGVLQLNTEVGAIEKTADGYRVGGIASDAVILATPAAVASKLVAAVASEAARRLRELRHTGIGTAYVAYKREDVPHALDGYGVVVPRNEGRRIDGMMWSSSKWPGRAPEGMALIRVFFGGPHTREVLNLSDDAIAEMVREELRSSLGITAPPLWMHIARWADGYPQYDVGHLDRVAAINASLPPGLVVTGSPYGGVGVPDCVRQGGEAAAKVVAHLNSRMKESAT